VHLRPLRSLSALTFASALFFGLAAPAAGAGAKDADAQKLFDSAINEDYLNAEFPKAEKKLKDALTKCGSGCSPELLGKIHVALGTVYAIGLSKPDDAKTQFTAALKADPKATLDSSLSNPDLVKLFEEVKKSSGGSSSKPPPDTTKPEPTKAASGDASHTPPAESQVNTPLPLYIEPSDEVPLSKVTLRYKPFGATQYKSAEMRKAGKGYAIEVPCEDVTTTGDVKYFFAFTGSDGEPAGNLGSNKEPFKTTIKNELEGDAPKLPGKKAPEQCKEKGDCPPGLPGCDSGKGAAAGGKRGDKGWGSSCDQTPECKEGLACLNGTCEEDKGGGGGGTPDDGKKKRMNLVGLGVQFDFLKLSSTSAACDGSNINYTCFTPGTSNQFFGNPVAFKTTDGISGGGAFAGARILVGYDRQLLRKIGLTVGARLGYAFGGPSAPTNLDAHGNPPLLVNGGEPLQNVALGFTKIHAEGRLSYFLFNSMMDDKKFRPYVFVGAGYGQVNASVPVAICDANATTAELSTLQNCATPGKTSVVRTENAYQVTGLGFAEFGAGTTFGLTPLFGIAAELKFMFMVPTFGVVIAPNIGPVFNF
jgi:hypothetical protein